MADFRVEKTDVSPKSNLREWPTVWSLSACYGLTPVARSADEMEDIERRTRVHILLGAFAVLLWCILPMIHFADVRPSANWWDHWIVADAVVLSAAVIVTWLAARSYRKRESGRIDSERR